MSSMSTPIDKLPSQGSQSPSRSIDDDPVVRDVIDEMEREVSLQYKQAQPVEVKTTHVATFNTSAPVVQQQQYAPQPDHGVHNVEKFSQKSSEWINMEYVKYSCLFAAIAFALFYPYDTTLMYVKYSFLGKLQPYELFVRAFLLAAVIYIILLKFQDA